jgi:hypothetical protein
VPNDEREPRPPQPTLFEKPPRVEQKRPGSRIPVGVYLGILLAVIVILAVVLFLAASGGGAGGNGHTTSGPTGGAVLLLLPTLLG